jgi:tetratricopeptide (TPR) repeat protein
MAMSVRALAYFNQNRDVTGGEHPQSENNVMPLPPQTPVRNLALVPLQSQVAALLAQGLALHQQGQLMRAKLIYEQVLAKQPQNFESLHLLGLVYLQNKNPDLAAELIGRAIQINSNDFAAHSNHGVALQGLKRVEEALASYDKAISIKPDYADAYFNRGIALRELRRVEEALASYDRAIALKSDYAEACYERAIALQGLERVEEALVSYDRAIAIKPDYVEAYSNRGVALQELKRLDEALASYDRAIEIKPAYAEAYSNRGNALRELNRLEEALASYDRAIAIKPDYAEAYFNRGNALRELKRMEEALASYDRAIAIKPGYAEAHSNRGSALQALKRAKEALASYDMAIAIKPDNAEAYSNRGVALQELKCAEDALASYDRAIAIKPDYAEAHSNRGNALRELKRSAEALASYDRAIAIKPDNAEAYSNRGVALQELKRLEEALASYDRAIAYKPDYAEAYLNKSLGLLLAGDLGRGWELYEWRWRYEQAARNFPQPLWLGEEDIVGKTILLHAEQGLGDTIQFCRYAKLVKALGAKVILEAPKALLGLLNGLEGVDELMERGNALPAFDFHCPLLSLPLAFKTDLTKIPSPQPYLVASSQKLDKWAQRLGAKSKPRVGLVWSGNSAHKNDYNRSLTLQQLLPHLPDCCEYVSLQKDVREGDRAVLEASSVKHYAEQLEDFTDTAALCELMDLVISVDTSVGHLAGAIGKTTWILLPYSPDWRWLLNRNDSPWYGSMTLYRQDETREWPLVLKRMRGDMEG